MPPETKELAWALPVAVQLILPIVLVILTGAGTWMVAKVRAKNERIKQEQDHALAIATQQADFDGRKKESAMARDKQLYDTQQQIITTLQAGQRDSAHREARMDIKFNELYGNLGSERDYSTEWEDWHRDGMPNPPGKPKRRPFAQPPATPPGGIPISKGELMPNMAVIYQGPNPSLSVLTAELRALFGNPARTYEYVTGYKSPTNVSGHNADANGRVHSVDIFVGPGNLTEAQGIWVAEKLRQEGKRGSIPGHPDRLAYIIHRGQIAGDHTGWEWIKYTGPDWHGDHIHVSSVFDYYWGDPVAGSPADYNSTIPWNLGTFTGPLSGSKPTPIPQKDWFDMATEATLRKIIKEEIENGKVSIARAVWEGAGSWIVNRMTGKKEYAETTLGSLEDRVVRQNIAPLRAQVTALTATVGVLAKTVGGDPAAITKAVTDAVADSLKNLEATVKLEAK